MMYSRGNSLTRSRILDQIADADSKNYSKTEVHIAQNQKQIINFTSLSLEPNS